MRIFVVLYLILQSLSFAQAETFDEYLSHAISSSNSFAETGVEYERGEFIFDKIGGLVSGDVLEDNLVRGIETANADSKLVADVLDGMFTETVVFFMKEIHQEKKPCQFIIDFKL